MYKPNQIQNQKSLYDAVQNALIRFLNAKMDTTINHKIDLAIATHEPKLEINVSLMYDVIRNATNLNLGLKDQSNDQIKIDDFESYLENHEIQLYDQLQKMQVFELNTFYKNNITNLPDRRTIVAQYIDKEQKAGANIKKTSEYVYEITL